MSEQLTLNDIQKLYQTPYGKNFATLEELAKAHECTVEELLAKVENKDDPAECVLAALKLQTIVNNVNHNTLDAYLLRRHMLNLLTFMLYDCPEALDVMNIDYHIRASYELNEAGNIILKDDLLIKTCQHTGLTVYREDNSIRCSDIQDLATDMDIEIKIMTFGLGIHEQLPVNHPLVIEWNKCKEDMLRIKNLTSTAKKSSGKTTAETACMTDSNELSTSGIIITNA